MNLYSFHHKVIYIILYVCAFVHACISAVCTRISLHMFIILACGGKIEAPSGVIESPGYPSGMHNFRYCLWMITVPKGRRVTLKFLDLDFEEVKNNWPLQTLSVSKVAIRKYIYFRLTKY